MVARQVTSSPQTIPNFSRFIPGKANAKQTGVSVIRALFDSYKQELLIEGISRKFQVEQFGAKSTTPRDLGLCFGKNRET